MRHKNWRQKMKYNLQDLGFNSYKEYLLTNHWKKLKIKFYKSKLFHGCCEACGRKNCQLHIHHRTYKRLGHERLNDLVALCSYCHQDVHNLVNNNEKINLWRGTKKIIKEGNKSKKDLTTRHVFL